MGQASARTHLPLRVRQKQVGHLFQPNAQPADAENYLKKALRVVLRHKLIFRKQVKCLLLNVSSDGRTSSLAFLIQSIFVSGQKHPNEVFIQKGQKLPHFFGLHLHGFQATAMRYTEQCNQITPVEISSKLWKKLLN